MATCEVCGKRAYSSRCVAHKVRKPIPVKNSREWHFEQSVKKANQRKAIKKHGKTHIEWLRTRDLWMKQNPKPWHCHYCSKTLDTDTLTLDHLIPRSRAPHLRFELSNLVPCCFTCNGLKGSIEHDKYEHVCHD